LLRDLGILGEEHASWQRAIDEASVPAAAAAHSNVEEDAEATGTEPACVMPSRRYSTHLMLPLPPTRLLPYPSVGASSSPCGRAKNLDVATFFLPRHMKLLSASHQSSASGIADIPFKHKLIMLRSQDSGVPTISTTIIV